MKIKSVNINKIFIIESLSQNETSGKNLYQWLKEKDITEKVDTEYIAVKNSYQFINALEYILEYARSSDGIILNIESHGSKKGIELQNKDFITWEKLHELSRAINIKTQMGLVIFGSYCFSGFSIDGIFRELKEAPYYLLFAPDSKLTENQVLFVNKELLKAANEETNISEAIQLINDSLNVNRNLNYHCISSTQMFISAFNWFMKDGRSTYKMIESLYNSDNSYFLVNLSVESGVSLVKLQLEHLLMISSKRCLRDNFYSYLDRYLFVDDIKPEIHSDFEADFDTLYSETIQKI